MRLIYSERALAQIDTALLYVAARSPAGASNIERRLAAVVATLTIHPGAGIKTRVASVRRAFLTPYPYAVDYFVGDQQIVVLRFRHTARKPL